MSFNLAHLLASDLFLGQVRSLTYDVISKPLLGQKKCSRIRDSANARKSFWGRLDFQKATDFRLVTFWISQFLQWLSGFRSVTWPLHDNLMGGGILKLLTLQRKWYNPSSSVCNLVSIPCLHDPVPSFCIIEFMWLHIWRHWGQLRSSAFFANNSRTHWSIEMVSKNCHSMQNKCRIRHAKFHHVDICNGSRVIAKTLEAGERGRKTPSDSGG